MPLCGFNKEMLEGLQLFCAGVWKDVQKRAEKDGLTTEESVRVEIDEMDHFVDVLSQLPEEPRMHAIKGVVFVARFLYQNVSDVGSADMQERFLAEADRFVELLRQMDEVYYAELRPGNEPKTALKQLGEWIRVH